MELFHGASRRVDVSDQRHASPFNFYPIDLYINYLSLNGDTHYSGIKIEKIYSDWMAASGQSRDQ